jgi:hypothetical protein
MFEKAIEEIYPLIGSPGWWFATVFVALLVNIMSAFIYDIIKPYIQSVTAKTLLWTFLLVHGFFIFLSCLYFNPTSHEAKNMLPVFAVLFPLTLFIGAYWEFRHVIILSVTCVIIFSLAVCFEVQVIPLSKMDTAWLAQQYYYSMLTSTFISSISIAILQWRELRSRRRRPRIRTD